MKKARTKNKPNKYPPKQKKKYPDNKIINQNKI